MKHILIGGNGFVGRHTATRLLKEGECVLVCDLVRSPALLKAVPMMCVDVTEPSSLASIPFRPDDVVYNFSARMLHPAVPRRLRHEYFYSVDYNGAVNVIHAMKQANCRRLIQFSTDMVYGRPQFIPITPEHPRSPLGEYSASKKAAEDYCIEQRAAGFNVSIFRPRLISGPGRLGVFEKLFRAIRSNLPIPLIGTGQNRYQMVSVFDCASAAIRSANEGVINGEFNLGSPNPPTVRQLLQHLIAHASSRSMLISTPAIVSKAALRLLDYIGSPILVPEQFEIADQDYILDLESTIRDLRWRPKHSDLDMLTGAYAQYLAHEKDPAAER